MPILGRRRAVWVAHRSGCECQLSAGRARLNDAEQARRSKCYFARSVRAPPPGRFAFHSSMVSGNQPRVFPMYAAGSGIAQRFFETRSNDYVGVANPSGPCCFVESRVRSVSSSPDGVSGSDNRCRNTSRWCLRTITGALKQSSPHLQRAASCWKDWPRRPMSRSSRSSRRGEVSSLRRALST